jgi:hypothetical protein
MHACRFSILTSASSSVRKFARRALVPAREETMLMLENRFAYRVIVSAICA